MQEIIKLASCEEYKLKSINFDTLLTDTVSDLINGAYAEYNNDFVNIRIEQIIQDENAIFSTYKVTEFDEVLIETNYWDKAFSVFEQSLKLHFT